MKTLLANCRSILAPRPRRTGFLLVAGVTGAALAFSCCLFGTHHAPPATPAPLRTGPDGVALTPDAPQWKYVDLAVAQDAPPLNPLPQPARIGVDPQRNSAVSAPLAGRIEQVVVRLGDRVTKGARLFSIRSGAFADVEKDAQAAHAAVAVKRKLAQRTRDLVALQAAPEKDLLAAEAELHEAELSLEAASAKLDSLRVAREGNNLFWVLAPHTGTVVELDVFASQAVSPDRDKPLLSIADLDEVMVIADVAESEAGDIAAGSPARVRTVADGLERSGTVEHVSEVVDPSRRTVEVRVRVANADRALRPNSFAEVEFHPSAKERVRVDQEAVVTDGPRSVIFVERAPGKLERVQVRPGRRRDGQVELLAGLEPGSRYVAHGALLLLNQIDLAQ